MKTKKKFDKTIRTWNSLESTRRKQTANKLQEQPRQSQRKFPKRRGAGEKARGKMESTARKNRGGYGVLEGLYRVIMRRTSVYATFVIIGAFAAERAVDYGVYKLWNYKNLGKRYEDIPVLGQMEPESE